MSKNDFLEGAPKFLTNRFNSINNYVWETLFPNNKISELLIGKVTKQEKKEEFKRLRMISSEASLLVFIFQINRFFIEGSEAAKKAVDTFKELEVDGFYIGGSYFSDRNENVLQGARISEALISSITDLKAKEILRNSKYVYQILDEYRKKI